MKIFLVGNTGFVGSNLSSQYSFDDEFAKENIENAYNKMPDVLFYAGVTGNKTMANNNPDADKEIINQAIDNIKKIGAKKLVLISTVDVYENTNNKTEKDKPDAQFPYGKHRAELEQWVQDNIKDYHIIRLPAIYGKNLRKNLIYDLVHSVPPFIDEKRYNDFAHENKLIKEKYVKNDYGFYELQTTTKEEYASLNQYLTTKAFVSINFTDSRAKFQFFDLDDLRNVIDTAIKNNIRILNVVTQPISSKELVEKLTGTCFNNKITDNFQDYNLKTIYYEQFGGEDGYIMSKSNQIEKILNYIKRQKKNEQI